MKAKLSFLLLLAWACSLPEACSQVTMDQLIGINTRAKDPLNRVQKFKFVRDYHDWSLDAGYTPETNPPCTISSGTVIGCQERCPQNPLRWNPSYDQGGHYNFDDFYTAVYRRAAPSLKGLAPEMRGYTNYPALSEFLEQKPFCNVPATYWNNFSIAPPPSLQSAESGCAERPCHFFRPCPLDDPFRCLVRAGAQQRRQLQHGLPELS